MGLHGKFYNSPTFTGCVLLEGKPDMANDVTVKSVKNGYIIDGTSKQKKPSVIKRAKTKISTAVSRDFHNKYGEGAEVTPKLAADYASDRFLGTAVVAATAAITFIKSRKLTDGITRAIPKNLKNIKNITEKGLLNKTKKFVSDVMTDVKKNNAAYINKLQSELPEDAGFFQKIKHALLRPVKFMNPESKLAGFIDKNIPKHSETVKKGLAKVGIKDGHGVIDLAIALGVAKGVKSKTIEIVDDVATSDDITLANEAGVDISKIPNMKIKLNNENKALEVLKSIDGLAAGLDRLSSQISEQL